MAGINWQYIDDVLRAKGFADRQRAISDIRNLQSSAIGRHLTHVDFDGAESGFSGPLKLKVKGTIPVNIGGTTYHIPIAFYLDSNYPYTAPKVYVEPTSGMMINAQGQGVRSDGLVSLWCFDHWNAGSSLPSCCDAMAQAFSQVTPVVAIPPGTQPPPPIRRQETSQPSQYSQHNTASLSRGASTADTWGGGGGSGGAAASGGWQSGGSAGAAGGWVPPAYPGTAGNSTKDDVQRTPSAEDPRILEAMRASERSAALDDVTRLLKQKLGPRHACSSTAIEKAAARRAELRHRGNQVNALRSKAAADVDMAQRACQWYGAELPLLDIKIKEFEAHVSALDAHEHTIVPTYPLYGQYMRLTSKYQALEDTILAIKQSHQDSGSLTDESLNTILSEIGRLARDQFRTLDLLQRVKETARIP
eukprot:m.43345 g.43345  ORF g.43345 m.43345 type:complete len:418 (+) comp6393_c0_seq1:74-1327(+)